MGLLAGGCAGAGLVVVLVTGDQARERTARAAIGGLERHLATRSELESWPREVETNIVMARVEDESWTPDALAARLEQEGVLVLPMGMRSLRFCTHLDVGPEDVERLERALDRILG